MDQILDENEQHMQDLDENTKQVGLYKVIFEINDQQRTIDLLLTTKKKKKKDIKQMIAIKMKRKLKEIKKVKLRFRKHIQGYTSGLDGTNAFFELKELQNQERKRKGQEKRLFSRYHIKKHPFKPQSRTVKWTCYGSRGYTMKCGIRMDRRKVRRMLGSNKQQQYPYGPLDGWVRFTPQIRNT